MTDKLTDLKFDQHNPRRHDERNLKVIGESLKATGPARSIVIDEDDNILAGNGVTEAAKAAGIERVIVVEAEDDALIAVRKRGLTPEQKTALKYYDNRSAELAAWEPEQILADLDAGLDMGQFWSEGELNTLLAGLDTEPKPDPGPQVDKAAELAEKWGTQTGQVWQLGEHRLAVGDCTDKAVVEAVMRGGEKAEILFTSPPYADVRDYGGNDISVKVLVKFISAFSYYTNYFVINLGLIFREGEVVQYWDQYIAEAKNCGLKFLAWNVWDKEQSGSIASATNMFTLTHEWIFVFGNNRKKLNRTIPNQLDKYEQRHGPNWQRGLQGKHVRQKDGNIKTTTSTTYTHHQLHSVIRQIAEKARNLTDYHPAIMRLELPEQYIEAMTNQDEIVIDPFLGSGTTIIACHNLKRKCRAIEIDPAYCAVAIQRWADLTGQQPALLSE